MKKTLLSLAVVSLLLCSTSANATSTSAGTTQSPAVTAQQNRMKTCAAQYHAKNIPKAQYHTFMSSCLKSPTTTKQSQ